MELIIHQMDELVIPQWAVFLGGGVVPWLIWLTLRSHQNEKRIAVISSVLEGIKESITGARVEFKISFDKLEERIDALFKEQYTNRKNE